MYSEQFISTLQVAEILGISQRHVRRLIADGQITARRVGHAYIVRIDDLSLSTGRPSSSPVGDHADN